jgi:hypothetical protein
MGMLVGIVLIPVYFTAPVSPETEGITDVVVKMSTTNVPSGDFRFLATVIGAYVIFGFAMYSILHEFQWFYLMRYEFLKKPLPRNYTVYVRCIPGEYLSQTLLRRYFERFSRIGRDGYQQHGVLESTIALEIPNLKKKVAQRTSVIAKLEHAINVEAVKQTIPQDRASGRSKVEVLYEQLDQLNNDITLMIEHIEESQATETEQEDLLAENSNQEHFVTNVTASLLSISMQTISSNGGSNDEDGGYTDNKVTTDTTVAHAGTNVVKLAGSIATKTAGVAATAATNAAGAALALFSSQDGKPTTAGFVTFDNLQAVHAALQVIQYPQPFAMEVLEAPDPDDIDWGNVGKKHKDLQIGKLISFSLTTLLCLFWTIPM